MKKLFIILLIVFFTVPAFSESIETYKRTVWKDIDENRCTENVLVINEDLSWHFVDLQHDFFFSGKSVKIINQSGSSILGLIIKEPNEIWPLLIKENGEVMIRDAPQHVFRKLLAN